MNKTVVVYIVIVILIAAIVGFFIATYKSTQKVSPVATVPFPQSVKVTQDSDLVQKSLSEVDGLVEIPDKEHAKVAEIINLKSLQVKSKIFKKAYEHDLVIFMPNETIIFDPLTKTIRDISKETYFNEVSK